MRRAGSPLRRGRPAAALRPPKATGLRASGCRAAVLVALARLRDVDSAHGRRLVRPSFVARHKVRRAAVQPCRIGDRGLLVHPGSAPAITPAPSVAQDIPLLCRVSGSLPSDFFSRVYLEGSSSGVSIPWRHDSELSPPATHHGQFLCPEGEFEDEQLAATAGHPKMLEGDRLANV